MARTLVGILQILLKQDVTQKAPAINRAIQSIESQANRLGTAKWGAAFERQLDRLKVTAAERAAIAGSYDRLARDINGKINRADLTAWRHGTLAHLTEVRAGLAQTAKQAKMMHSAIAGAKTRMGDLAKPALVALGAYTGWYAAGVAMREGFNASGERQREFFRQDMAGIPAAEQASIAAKAQALTLKYPSVGMTEVMEMARTARNTMGTTQDGLTILEDMVRGLVTLQSSQGVEAGSEAMLRLIRGLDNMGLNSGGEIGIASMREVMAGAIRAAQIEGGEIDVGQYFDFARRAKVAGPALSNEFLATTVAALMQDMTAQGAGTAIASAYQSLVVGSSAVASKVNLKEQRRLGLREGEGGPQGMGNLVDSSMYGQNPYQWVKKHLIPALAADGVDMGDEVAVTQAVAKISRNTMATGLLTRLVTQSPQIERLIGMYSLAMGPEAADQARTEDPFVAVKGLTTSLQNLAAALGEHVMPVIVPALNSLADGINMIGAATRDASGAELGIASLAAIVGGIGAFKVGSAAFGGLVALTTAGPSLQTAATMLQGAATSLNGGTAADMVGEGGGKGNKNWLAGLAAWGASVAVAAGPGLLSEMTSGSPGSVPEYNAQVANQSHIKAEMWDKINSVGGLFSPAPTAPAAPLDTTNGIPGLAGMLAPQALANMGVEANKANDAVQALNGTVAPKVDSESLRAALDLANQLKAALQGIGTLISSSSSNVRSEINGTYADYGVAP